MTGDEVKKVLHLVLMLPVILLLSVLTIVTLFIFIDNSLNEYFKIIRSNIVLKITILSLAISLIYFISFLYTKDGIRISNNFIVAILYSYAGSSLLMLFNYSPYWYLKFSNGLLIGLIASYSNKFTIHNGNYFKLMALSLVSAFFGSFIEYFLTMEPPLKPTIIYISSFDTLMSWLITILWITLSPMLSNLLYRNFQEKARKTNKKPNR